MPLNGARVVPGAVAGRHTHPGDEVSYVLEGETEVLIDGQPPRIVKAGESFVIPAEVVHDARNASGAPVKLVGVYIKKKGKPLAAPDPEYAAGRTNRHVVVAGQPFGVCRTGVADREANRKADR